MVSKLVTDSTIQNLNHSIEQFKSEVCRANMAVPMWLLWGLLVTMTFAWAEDDPYCTSQTPDDNQPPLPDLNVPAFISQYRVTIKEKKYTQRARISYDYVRNKARMDYIEDGKNSTNLYDYADNAFIQYVVTSNDPWTYECTIEAITDSNSDIFSLFPFSVDESETPHVASSLDILWFSEQTNPIYKGQTELDGLIVDHWQSCNTWEDEQATFTLDYYFTTADFQSLGSVTLQQIPFRAYLKGTMPGDDDSTINLDHVYEYLQFQAYETLPATTFSLPDFVVCTRPPFLWSKVVPSLSATKFYSVETVTRWPGEVGETTVTVAMATVYHDALRRLVRLESGRSISISDFNTGVEYLIEENGCSTRAISPENVQSAMVDAAGYVEMGDNPEIAYLMDGAFEYTGEKLIRDIPAVAFARLDDLGGDLVEVYYNQEETAPLGVFVRNQNTQVETFYHIYNFVGSVDKYGGDPFDIGKCQNNTDVANFDLILSTGSSSEEEITESIGNILAILKNAVADVARISTLQISHNNYLIDPSKGELHWRGIFLTPEFPDNIANVSNALITLPTDSIFTAIATAVGNSEVKVELTDDTTGFTLTLLATHIISLVDNLTLHIEDGNDVVVFEKTKDMCVNYLDYDYISTAKESEYACAQACFDYQWRICNAFQYVEVAKVCQMGKRLELSELDNNMGCDYFSINYLDSYFAFDLNVLAESEDDKDALDLSAGSAELCAQLCIDEASIDCYAFKYCEEDGHCILGNTPFVNESSIPDEDNISETCQHYSRKSPDGFSITETSQLKFADQMSLTVRSVAECAYLCSYDVHDCHIFSVCSEEDIVLCVLVPDTLINNVTYAYDPDCAVYTNTTWAISDALSSSTTDAGGKDLYSVMDLIGVSLTMVVVGFAVGALSVFVIRRTKLLKDP